MNEPNKRTITLGSREWQTLVVMNTNDLVEGLRRMPYPTAQDIQLIDTHLERIRMQLGGWQTAAKQEGLEQKMAQEFEKTATQLAPVDPVPIIPPQPSVQADGHMPVKKKGWPKGQPRKKRIPLNESPELPPVTQ